ncbi:peptidoglycan recognition protein [Streptomyces sp. NPDC058691]|uniref:peptidoglycan recognition protein family protein n=1 Tax=Streptomyces sp. NPDC058691 TaxID=3346601 RepID=UPI003667D535
MRHRRIRLRGRAWIAVGAVLLGGAGAATAVAVQEKPKPKPVTAGKKPVPSAVHTMKLEGTGGKRDLPQRRTDDFGMLGVTWTDPDTQLKGTVQVRTRSVESGKWSDWHSVDPFNDELPDPGSEGAVRGGSAPVYVGLSNGVQVKMVGKNGEAGLPKGLRVDLVGDADQATGDMAMAPAAYAVDADVTDSASPTSTDPAVTDSPSDTVSPSASGSTSPSVSAPQSSPPASSSAPATSASATKSASASPTSTRPTAPASSVAKPSIVTRAGWGADETIRESGDPDYADKVSVVFVHHTDTQASYDCSDSAAMVRWIYAYHVQSLGWRDIGYNALVDKCGKIFEGRYGGIDLPVIGAHTYGFNTRGWGIAALGTYQVIDGVPATPITSQMLGSVAALSAWKLGQYGINPNPGSKTQSLVEGASDSYGFTKGTTYHFNPISGHRDGFATACPGQDLYDKLGTIRSYAAGPVAAPTLTGVSGGAALSGSSYYTKGAATVSWKTTTPSAVIKRFEVLVDGTVAATAGRTATSAAITVPAGKHTVTVQAVHISGKTSVSGSSYTIVGDTTKPTFTIAPEVKIRNATVSSTVVPVSVTWKAADNGALKSVAATAPTAATFGLTTTSWSTTGKPSTAVAYGLKATDMAGNYGTASVSRTTAILQETSATRSGTWTAKSSTSYLGGKSLTSSSKNAGLTWTFTGRSVGWVVSRASTSGQAYVYVDGVRKATVDLKSSTTLYRQTIWSTSWTTSAKHTLKIVVVGTTGRPTITTDGITYIK